MQNIQWRNPRTVAVAIIGFCSIIYILNPTLGLFEILPDNIPLLGNLDEGGAYLLLFSALAYFGLDIRNIFKKEEPKPPKQ